MTQCPHSDLELLINLAAQTDMDYRDAYFVWQRVHNHPSAYLIVKAVLCMADRLTFPIEMAYVTWLMCSGRLKAVS